MVTYSIHVKRFQSPIGNRFVNIWKATKKSASSMSRKAEAERKPVSQEGSTEISAGDLVGPLLFAIIVPLAVIEAVLYFAFVQPEMGQGGALVGLAFALSELVPALFWVFFLMLTAPFFVSSALRAVRVGYAWVVVGMTLSIFTISMLSFVVVGFADPVGAWPIALQDATLHGPISAFLFWQVLLHRYPEIAKASAPQRLVGRLIFGLAIVVVGQSMTWPLLS